MAVVMQNLLQSSKTVHKILFPESVLGVLVDVGAGRKHCPRFRNDTFQRGHGRLAVAKQQGRLFVAAEHPWVTPGSERLVCNNTDCTQLINVDATISE